MREYTFVRGDGEKKVIEARSLKKAIIKYGGAPRLCNLQLGPTGWPPCTAPARPGAPRGGRSGTLAAEVSQKRRPYSCRGPGASVWRGNLNAFTHFYVPNFRKNDS